MDDTLRIIHVNTRCFSVFNVFRTMNLLNKGVCMEKMKLKNVVTYLCMAVLFTILAGIMDVQAIRPEGRKVGFALMNGLVHRMTGMNRLLYEITDWFGLIPLVVCVGFGIIGIVQSIRRENPFKADHDLIALGVYYVIVIFL